MNVLQPPEDEDADIWPDFVAPDDDEDVAPDDDEDGRLLNCVVREADDRDVAVQRDRGLDHLGQRRLAGSFRSVDYYESHWAFSFLSSASSRFSIQETTGTAIPLPIARYRGPSFA